MQERSHSDPERAKGQVGTSHVFRSHFDSSHFGRQALLLAYRFLCAEPYKLLEQVVRLHRTSMLSYLVLALLQFFAACHSCDLDADQQRRRNTDFHDPFQNASRYSSRSTRHYPHYDISMVAGAEEPPRRRTRRNDMDVIMEEDDDMDLEDTTPPVPTPVMPTTSPITIPTITTSMMKGSQ